MWYNKFFILFISLTFLFLFSTCKSNNEIVNTTNPLVQYTLVLQPDSTVGKDALISFYYPDTNFGNHMFMHPDCWTIGASLEIVRGFIQFDLSSIPNDATIDSAFISFYYAWDTLMTFTTAHYGDNYMLLQRIIEPWDEHTVTWNNQPNIDTKHTVWIDKFAYPQQDYKDIDVTLLVKDVFASNKNYGFMLRMSDEVPYKITQIASSDYPDASKHPKLVVYYTK